MIFYFTATGNCCYVAEQLDSDACSIPREMQREGELAYQDEAIGIVYPIYSHMMPDRCAASLNARSSTLPTFTWCLRTDAAMPVPSSLALGKWSGMDST